ncbi:MAG: cytochrome C554 and C-prime, partial [Leptospira sp.]|nr:cytochrome C554 and C-prime [Leptospira sp.]
PAPPAPQPTTKNPEFLKNRCLDCHNETYEVNQNLVCSFQTGTEIVLGPSNSCANCHMPEIKRQIVKSELNTLIRKSHKHGFVGGGVPKEYSLYPHQVYLGYKPGIILSEIAQNGDTIKLSIKNAFGGHSVPSGDPERFYRMEWKGKDSSGQIVFNDTKEFGQTWEWSPKAKKIADNRLVSEQIFVWEKKVPSNVETFIVTAKHIRLKNSASDYMSKATNHKDPVILEKIKNIRANYPHSSTVLETKWTKGKKDRRDTDLQELMNRNEKSFGE